MQSATDQTFVHTEKSEWLLRQNEISFYSPVKPDVDENTMRSKGCDVNGGAPATDGNIRQ